MVLLKLGVLTCVFYVALTTLLEAGVWPVAYYHGFGIFFSSKHWFWTVGLKLGVIFGALWIASFAAAWSIVYYGLKSQLQLIPK